MKGWWLASGVLVLFLLGCAKEEPLTCTAPAVQIGNACCADADNDGLCDPTYAQATCKDGLQNQGEAGPDCGGPCPGYWYGGACHGAPLPAGDCSSSVVFSGACEKLCIGYEYDPAAGMCREVSGGCCEMQSPFETMGACVSACGGPKACGKDSDCPPARYCVNQTCQARLETCVDGVQNQDETHPDCGGVCGGYWYEERCQKAEPPQCESASDCKLLFSKCDCLAVSVTDSRENWTGGADSCAENLCKGWEPRCIKGNCTAEPALPPRPTVTLRNLSLYNESQDLVSVGRAIIEFEADAPGSIDWFGYIYVYKDDNDRLAKTPQGSRLETGSIMHGTTLTKTFAVSGIPYRYDSGPRVVRIEWFDRRTRQYLFSMIETVTIQKNYEKRTPPP